MRSSRAVDCAELSAAEIKDGAVVDPEIVVLDCCPIFLDEEDDAPDII